MSDSEQELDLEQNLEISTEEESYEEISSDVVDRVVASLETLNESVESENIRQHLEEAINNIYYLVYEDEEEEGESEFSEAA